MNIGKKLVDALRAKTKPSAYDTSAVVKRIEGQTAWVSISGGVDETPVKISIDAKPGDNVNVRVSGGKAWITGNNTAPPTDDKTAKAAMNATKKASNSLKIIEDKIENGDFDGKDGTSVNDVTAQYCLANASAIPAGQTFDDIQYSAWQDTIPEYAEGKYYWMRLKIVYSDGTVGYNAPVFDLGTQASVEADIAAAAAASAASDAEEIAQQALSGVGTIENHFWADSSGVHVSESDGSVASGASQTISSNGTVMMRNGKLVTSWTGSGPGDAAINFYDCTYGSARTSDLVASYGRTGITQYINNVVAMALTASGLSFYTPDANHKLQAVFGTSGVELYAAGVKRMVITSSGITMYAQDGVTKMSEYSFSTVTQRVNQQTIKTDTVLLDMLNSILKIEAVKTNNDVDATIRSARVSEFNGTGITLAAGSDNPPKAFVLCDIDYTEGPNVLIRARPGAGTDNFISLGTEHNYQTVAKISSTEEVVVEYGGSGTSNNAFVYNDGSSDHIVLHEGLVKDYVTEYGEKSSTEGYGSWTYRKWKSGKIEAWAAFDVYADGSGTQIGSSGIYRKGWTVALPTSLFSSSSPPTGALVTLGTNSTNVIGVNHQISGSSISGGAYRIGAFASSSLYLRFYVWKN